MGLMTSATARHWFDRPGRPGRWRSRATIGWLSLVFVVSQLTLTALLEFAAPGLRDPEYRRKLQHLQARQAEYPGHPLVVALGSSRVGMGVRPAALEGYPAVGEPLVVNLGLI